MLEAQQTNRIYRSTYHFPPYSCLHVFTYPHCLTPHAMVYKVCCLHAAQYAIFNIILDAKYREIEALCTDCSCDWSTPRLNFKIKIHHCPYMLQAHTMYE